MVKENDTVFLYIFPVLAQSCKIDSIILKDSKYMDINQLFQAKFLISRIWINDNKTFLTCN